VNHNTQNEFFGSFIGSEAGIPKVSKTKRWLNTFDIGITANEKTIDNRKHFLKEVERYLNNNGIETLTLKTRIIQIKNNSLLRLMISTKFENVFNFVNNIKINYCFYKAKKIRETLDKFTDVKYQRYKDLIQQGNTIEETTNILNLSEIALKHILSVKEIS
jgi:hypothetical protein